MRSSDRPLPGNCYGQAALWGIDVYMKNADTPTHVKRFAERTTYREMKGQRDLIMSTSRITWTAGIQKLIDPGSIEAIWQWPAAILITGSARVIIESDIVRKMATCILDQLSGTSLLGSHLTNS